MENHKLEEFVEIRLKYLRAIFAWPQKTPTWKSNFITILAIIYMTTNVGFVIDGLIDIYDKDMEQLILNSLDTGCTFSGLTKMFYTLYGSDKFRKVLQALAEVTFPNDGPLCKHLDNKIKLANFLMIVLVGAVFGDGMFQVLLGLYTTLFGEGREFPVHTGMNVNEWPSWLFWVSFVSEGAAMFHIGLVIVLFDATCLAFISFAVAKMRVLKSNLNSINELINHSKITVGAHDKEVEKKLGEFVRDHVIVSNFVDSIEDAFCYLVLIELFVILVLSSIVLMNLVITPLFSMSCFINISFLMGFLSVCAAFCFHGNELIVESEELWEAMYLLNWHYFGNSQRRTVFIMMERAIRPLQITAGKFVVLDNRAFLNVCQTAFSYFTVILQLYSDSAESK